jgi:hypothetical protein
MKRRLPSLARNGHAEAVATCPLLKDQRTSLGRDARGRSSGTRGAARDPVKLFHASRTTKQFSPRTKSFRPACEHSLKRTPVIR